mgnify:CR=1 FL=1
MNRFDKVMLGLGLGAAAAFGYIDLANRMQPHDLAYADAYAVCVPPDYTGDKDVFLRKEMARQDSLMNVRKNNYFKAHRDTCSWCKKCEAVHAPLNFIEKLIRKSR